MRRDVFDWSDADAVIAGYVGAANTVWIDPRTGTRVGVADVRSPVTDATRR